MIETDRPSSDGEASKKAESDCDRLSMSDFGNAGLKKNTSIDESSNPEKGGYIKVPVNEDYLFDVDVEKRELAPTYWLGSIYDV